MSWEYVNPWHSHCKSHKRHNICKSMCKCDCQCLYVQQNNLSALMFSELACILKASHNLYTLNNSVWFFLHLQVKVCNLQYTTKYRLYSRKMSCKICQLHKLNSICNVKFQVLASQKRTGICSHCYLTHMI